DCSGKCDLSTNDCCERPFVVDGGNKCQPKAQQCMGTVVECKESGDCMNGQVCCLSVQANGSSATCKAKCAQVDQQLCRRDQDCSGNKPCTPKMCFGQTRRGACR